MQKKRAAILSQEWGGKPCAHPKLAKEYDMGQRTGNFVCTQCGSILSFREKAELKGTAGAVTPHKGEFMKKSSRNIPDFSRKPSARKSSGTPNAAPSGKGKLVTSAPPRPKPQATAGKSGQRGK